MTYRSVMQNTDPYEGPAVIGIYHTINEPFYFGGETAWQVSVNIDVNQALINTSTINIAGITSANVGILDVASLQSSYQVAEGVLSGITSTNRLNLTYDPSINTTYVLKSFTTTATSDAGIGTNIIPAVVSVGGSDLVVGDFLVNDSNNIIITGIATTSIAGLGTTTAISLGSTISSGISSGGILTFKQLTWVSSDWSNSEGGRVIDIDVSKNMVIVGGIATEPIWNFKNYSNQNSRMATISVVGISTKIISGAGASDAVYSPGNVSAGSSFMLNGQFQYYATSPSLVYKEILWDQGTEPDFIDSKMSVITFRIVNDDAGNVYILGSKDGEFYEAP